MLVSLTIFALGLLQLVSGQNCAKKSTTTCKLQSIDYCTSTMKKMENSLKVFSTCLLKYNSIDHLINCTGDNDEQLCMSTKPIQSYRLKVSLDRNDGENDQCWCFKARGVLYLAALNQGCLLEDYFEICPQKDVSGFRSCLCHLEVSTENIECLAEKLNLKHAEPDFSKQCRRKRPQLARPTIREISPISTREEDFTNTSDTPEHIKRGDARSVFSSNLPHTTAEAATPSVPSGGASTTSGALSTPTTGSMSSSYHNRVSHGLMGAFLLLLALLVM